MTELPAAIYRRMAAEGDYAHLRIPPQDSPACGGRHRRNARPYFAPDDSPVCPTCAAKVIDHTEWQIASLQRKLEALRSLPLAKKEEP